MFEEALRFRHAESPETELFAIKKVLRAGKASSIPLWRLTSVRDEVAQSVNGQSRERPWVGGDLLAGEVRTRLARLCLRPTRVRKRAARRHSRSGLSSTVLSESHSRQRLPALSRAERTLRSVGCNRIRLNLHGVRTCDQQILLHPVLALGRKPFQPVES